MEPRIVSFPALVRRAVTLADRAPRSDEIKLALELVRCHLSHGHQIDTWLEGEFRRVCTYHGVDLGVVTPIIPDMETEPGYADDTPSVPTTPLYYWWRLWFPWLR